jgi:predicted O-linked N-acetylglucosamine transferase (SPINDLY family)
MSRKATAQIESLLAEALASHRAGNFPQAERRYSDILEIEAANPKVLTLFGTLRAQQGDFQDAIRLLGRSLKIDKRQPFALNSLGNALHAMKRHGEAIVQYERAIGLKADHVAYTNRGNALMALNRHAEALQSYSKAIALDPGYAEAHSKRGDILRALKRNEDAILSYDAALARRPGFAQDHFGRALALQAWGRADLAVTAYDEAITHRADFAEAYNNRGNALASLGHYQGALDSYVEAIRLRPDYAEAWNNRGNALRALDRSPEALDHYERAIGLNSKYAMAHYNCGITLRSSGRYDEALARFQNAASLDPNFADAHVQCGHILRTLDRPKEALANYDSAIRADPSSAEVHRSRGELLRKFNRHDEAVKSYDCAIALKPDLAAAHLGRGLSLKALKRDAAALVSYDTAVALRPDEAAGHYYRSIVLRDLHRLDEALASISQAVELDGKYPYARGQLFNIKMHMCDWDGLAAARAAVVEGVEAGELAAVPFPLQLIDCDLSLYRKCAELFMEKESAISLPAAPSKVDREAADRRIRVAYLSADFHAHATAYLMAGVFEEHDRSRFETYGVSFGPDDETEMRARIEKGFDHFFDARGCDNAQVASLLREWQIDMAVDLKGHTRDARPGIFALRPAPIQVSYLGFSGTSGVDYFDYLIADRIVVPEEHQPHYSEKLVYLPDTYQCNDSKRPAGGNPTSRAESGLPDQGFVFCCFNHNYKITPEVFHAWMRILAQVDDSVLWLLRSNPAAERNLRREAEKSGVSGERLIFAPRLPYADHLARLRLADLFLDTLPYGAHTTASDALWSGVPVLTRMGRAFAGRVGASLINAVGLPEMVTYSMAEYEARALALVRDRALLAEIRSTLARNRSTHPLFDTARFTRHLEAAYVRMVERLRNGEGPEGFAVQALGKTDG